MTAAPVNLLGLTVSRFGSSVASMVYAGSLPFVIELWHLTGTQAGFVQSSFNLFYALSLLVTSWAADHFGAKRLFIVALWFSFAASAAIGLFARDYVSALLLFSVLAAALGGTYAPAIMLVASSVEHRRRGTAIGWILSGSSLGYFAAIACMAWAVPVMGLSSAWLMAALAPGIAAITGTLATRRMTAGKQKSSGRAQPNGFRAALLSRRSSLLTAGYTAHCWELLGMWAWAPAFLTLVLMEQTDLSPFVIGLVAAGAIHLSGAASTLCAGMASDRLGRRTILITMAVMGAALSFSFGWSVHVAPWLVVTLAAVYGFAVIGDSGVLSTAMTESVPSQYLGSMLALRSILGFGAGAISPLAFGFVYDLSAANGPTSGWGPAFAMLGLGGVLAALCSAMLPREKSPSKGGGPAERK